MHDSVSLYANMIKPTTAFSVVKNTKNLFFLNLFLRSATIIGIFPVATKPPSGKLNCPLLIIIILMGIWSVSIIVSAFKRFTNTPPNALIFKDYIEGTYLLVSLALYLSLVLRNIHHPYLKMKILHKLRMFDEKCFIEDNAETCRLSSMLRYLAAHIACPLLCFLNMMVIDNWNDFNKLLIVIPLYIEMCYETFMTTFLWELATVIESRYKYVKFRLGNLLIQNSMNHPIFILHTIQIKTLFGILYSAMKQVNILFGFVMLVTFAHMVLQILIKLQLILLVKSHSNDLKFLDFIVSCLFVLVSKNYFI